MKRINILDLASGAYIGFRLAGPVLDMASGRWTVNDGMKEIRYRFGGIGGDGKFAPMGAVETYLPPIVMQVIKKGMHKAGFHFNLGPFSI